MDTPRVFISYSWSSPDHENWVLKLAEHLSSEGVHVLIDKWDLGPGGDAVAFMERMVTDKDIDKVILVCDRAYAEKADSRRGGVGTEAQIISSTIYEKVDQNKFVAAIAERDEAGKAFVPVYYKSRIHIDLSSPERWLDGVDELLRWIYGKPLYVRPALGRQPEFVTNEASVTSASSFAGRKFVEAMRSGRPTARGLFAELLSALARDLEACRVGALGEPRDETVVSAIRRFIPARDEFLSAFTSLVQFGIDRDYGRAVQRFLEAQLPLMDRPSGVSTWDRDAYDNFKYCVHELFLYVVAILLKHEQIEIAHFVISSPYVVSTASGRKVASFLAFREHAVSFDTRGQRTKRLSARADLLKELCSGVFVDYSGLMQADFVCYLRAALREEQWWPETLLFAAYQYGPFELFARASSHRYLTTLLPLFGILDVGQLRVQLELLSRRGREAVPWRFEGLSVATLANLEGMGSME